MAASLARSQPLPLATAAAALVVLARVPANLVVLDHLPLYQEWRRRADTDRPPAWFCLSHRGWTGGRAPTTSLSGASPALPPAGQGPRPVSPKRGVERKRLPPFRGRPFIIILAVTSVERGPKRLRQGFSTSGGSTLKKEAGLPSPYSSSVVGIPSSASPPSQAKRSPALQDPPPRPQSHAPSPLSSSPSPFFPFLGRTLSSSPPSLLRRSPGTDERA